MRTPKCSHVRFDHSCVILIQNWHTTNLFGDGEVLVWVWLGVLKYLNSLTGIQNFRNTVDRWDFVD